MAFSSRLGAFTDIATRIGKDSAEAEGLALADETIEAVIKVIQDEEDKLNPTEFENSGHISSGSFGGGDRAPTLALHYALAHEVTADTLKGVRKDLRAFQDACREARKVIAGADQDAADRLHVSQVAVESLTTGSWSNWGERSHEQAQQDHGYDSPPDEQETEDS